jgi:hypothetical protein
MLTKDSRAELAERTGQELNEEQPIPFSELLDASRYELLLIQHDKDYAKGTQTT